MLKRELAMESSLVSLGSSLGICVSTWVMSGLGLPAASLRGILVEYRCKEKPRQPPDFHPRWMIGGHEMLDVV